MPAEPAKLTLRFYDPETTRIFTEFCRRSETVYEQERDNERDADVFKLSFENKSRRSLFIGAWNRVNNHEVVLG